MAIPSTEKTMCAFALAGKLGKSGGFGRIRWGVYAYGYNKEQAGVWQMRMTKTGKVPVVMKFYRPTNPQSIPQEANRTKFGDAMSAWGALTAPEKAEYARRAKRRAMFPWGLFVREYYLSH